VSEPVVVPSGAAAASAASPQWFAAARRAKALSWLSLVWMGLEGGIAVLAGILAGSIALIGFGIDSAIEGVASVVIIWRFTGARALSHAAEERAQKLVAIQFFILAPYVSFEAISALVNAEHPEISGLGMALTASSVIGMPLLGVAKQRVARTLGSQALFGWWWLDPIAALFIAAVAVHEGAETWRGEGCCVSPVLTSASVPVDDDCCTEEVSHRLRTEGGDHIGVWVGDRRGANR
jgi:divalent metal cation (Fe/Co/Zn/Cd) transporter